jgi:hypothetical protein
MADLDKIVVGETPKGKKLTVYQDHTPYYKVQFTTGGQLPKELTGRYMDYSSAAEAIKNYLQRPKKKVVKPKITKG